MLKLGEFVKNCCVGGGLLVAGVMLAPGCAVDDDAVASKAPLAELALANGTIVSFYEPQPGALLISQDSPVGVAPVRLNNPSATELHASLAPGQPVPAALVAAQSRADEARAGRERSPATAQRSNIGAPTTQSYIDNKTIDDVWFVNNYCGGSWDIISCMINKTYPVSQYKSDVDEAYFTTCADVGAVTMRTQIGGDPMHAYDIYEGHCYAYHWTSGWLNDSVYGGVINVDAGERFHFSARFNY